VAVITGEATADTNIAVTVNVTEFMFAGTTTLAGTVAAAVLLLDSVTVAPPDGAVPLKVTVAIEFETPPVTVVGLSARFDSVGGFTVSVALAVPPPVSVAEMWEVDNEATGALVTVNVAELLPAGTVTEVPDRVATAVLSLATLTTTPSVGAVAFRITVAVEVLPPITLGGSSVTAEICGGFTIRFAVLGTPSV
jgi:hypothetical protein